MTNEKIMQEFIEKASAAKSPEEIVALAKENGIEDFTEENAKAYFAQLHKSGELSDDELDNVSGGYTMREEHEKLMREMQQEREKSMQDLLIPPSYFI